MSHLGFGQGDWRLLWGVPGLVQSSKVDRLRWATSHLFSIVKKPLEKLSDLLLTIQYSPLGGSGIQYLHIPRCMIDFLKALI